MKAANSRDTIIVAESLGKMSYTRLREKALAIAAVALFTAFVVTASLAMSPSAPPALTASGSPAVGTTAPSSTANAPFAEVPEAEAKTVRDAISGRFTTLHNLECEYTSEFSSTPDPMLVKEMRDTVAKLKVTSPGTTAVLPIGDCKLTGSFSILDDRQMNSIFYPKEAEALDLAHKWVAMAPEDWIITPERTEHLIRPVGRRSGVGEIDTASNDLPNQWNIDYGLGLRAYGGYKFLTEDDWKHATLLGKSGTGYTFEMATPGGLRNRWTFDPSIGFALVRYELLNANGEVPRLQVDCSDFRKIAGTSLPFAIEFRSFDPMRAATLVTLHITTTVQKYLLNDASNTPERYRIVWPHGSGFVDKRTGQQYDIDGPARSFTDGELKAEALRIRIKNAGELK